MIGWNGGRRLRSASVGLVLAAMLASVGSTLLPPPADAALQPGAGQFVPLTTARMVNDVSVAAGTTYSFTPLGRVGVPTSGVSAVTVTMTTRSAGSGHLIVHPAGTATPGTSNLNYRPDLPTTNSVTVALGGNGQISVRNAGTTDAARLWVDVSGYFTSTAPPGAGSTYVPLVPARIVANVANPAQDSLAVSPLGRGGVPAANVSAVVANVMVRAEAAGLASVYPDGMSRPVTTALNYRGDHVYNNQVTVKLSESGRFRVFTSTAVEVTVDVVGYYQSPGGTAAGGSFVAVTPSRLPDVTVPANGTHTFTPLGKGGIPATGVGAAAFNLTAVAQTNAGSIVVFPAGATRPAASQLAYRVGGAWPALQLARPGTNGQISIYNGGAGAVRLITDLVGWFRTPGAPAAPTGVSAEAGDGETVVRWSRPAGDGGAAITGYRVTASPGGATADVVDVTSTVFANLSNGTAYTFTVAARNAVGQGPQSAPSAAATPIAATPPGAPTGVTARPRHTAAIVAWQRPADDGRLAIESYTVTASPGGATATVIAPATEAEVPGLTNGTAYTFRVAATNARGTGPAGAGTTAVVPRVGVPDPPVDAIAGATDTDTVTVGWNPPRYTGGQPLTGFTVAVQPGGRRLTAAAGTDGIDVTGLTPGTAYTFTVTADNAGGSSPASATTAPVTPDLQLQADARMLSPAALATLSGVSLTSVVFTDAPAEVTGLTAGTVVVAADPPAPHDPFLARVTAVSTSGPTTTLSVEQATLPDAFADGGFSLLSSLLATDGPAVATRAIEDERVRAIGPVEIHPGVKISGTYTSSMRLSIDFDLFPRKFAVRLDTTDRIELVITADREASLPPLDRLVDDDTTKLSKKMVGRVLRAMKPSLRQQVYVIGSGKVHAGMRASTASAVDTHWRLNLLDFTDRSVTMTPRHEAPSITASADADATFGIRTEIALMTYLGMAMEARITEKVRVHIDTHADPWFTVDGCLDIAVETTRKMVLWLPPRNETVFDDCYAIWRAKGPMIDLTVTPGDVALNRNQAVTFGTESRFGPGTPTWSVEGTGNGTIDPATGRYVAPDKDGVFVVVARIAALGGRPPQKGTARVRVGAPGPVTATVAPLSPLEDGTTRVHMTLAPTGTPADFYTARIDPLGADSLCSFWQIPGPVRTVTLLDRLAIDPTVRCRSLVPGNTYTFLVTSHNEIGSSPEYRTNAVTVTGAAVQRSCGGTDNRCTGVTHGQSRLAAEGGR